MPKTKSTITKGGIELPSSSSGSGKKTFGDYELLEEIGRGGMGVIWKARQVTLGRLVAVKMIRDSQLASPKARERFRVEAEAAGKLHHPNIVPIYEFGTVEGNPYICMLLVEGSDLVKMARGTPQDPVPLARLMVKLAHAIHFAHQRGVLHLDLKPANVLVDAQGEPHVTDFGLARRLDVEESWSFTSEVIGSPNYMAPEQALGRAEEITTAADVYSLGAIMYELLSGRAPFRSESPLITLRKVQEEEPVPPRTLYKFADRELETICLKCLEKRSERRYTSARAFAADLERWLRHEPIKAIPVTVVQRVGKWVRRNPRIATLVALVHIVLILGLSGIVWMGARASARARESHDRLLRTYVTGGNQLIDVHEDFTALLWLVEALRQENRGPVYEENHRYRIEAALRRSSMLQQAFFQKDHIRAANFDRTARRLIIGNSGGSAQVWDVTTGQSITPEMKLPAPVHRTRFHPDGRRVVTMDIKGNARIWDATTGAPLTPLLRGDDYQDDATAQDAATGAPITPVLHSGEDEDEPFDWAVLKLDPSAWFSGDGRILLTAWGCRSAHLWDVATGRHLRKFPHQALVINAKFSPDGKYVVTGSKDNTARLWDVQTGEMVGPPLLHARYVSWTGFHPDGRRLLIVSGRRLIHVWDWRKGTELISPLSHGDLLFAAAFNPDGTRILSAGRDKTARIWDTATGLELNRFSLPGGVVAAAWSPDGRSFATASEDGIARIWDATGSGRLLAALPHGAGNFYLSFNSDGKRLVTFGFNGTARVWETSPPDRSALEMKHSHSVWAEFSPDGARVVSACFWPANNARVFNAATGVAESPLMQHASAVRRARFSPDNARVVTASDDFTAQVWDAKSGGQMVPPLRHPGVVLDAVFSPDGRVIATACQDGAARLWESASGRLGATLRHDKKVGSIAFSADGRLLATASDDLTVRIWNVISGQPIVAPLPHAGAVNSVRFNHDGTLILSSSRAPDNGRGSAQVWEVRSGKLVGKLIEHDDDVNGAEFSPDENFIVTASQDRTARVWDAVTHQPVTPPLRHLDGVIEARFSRDGRRVATLSQGGDLRLWDAITGEAITTSLPNSHGSELGHLAFSSDGKRLLIASGGDGPIIREFKPSDQPVSVLVNQAEMLTGQRLDPVAGLQRLDSAALAEHWQLLTLTPKH